MAGPKHNDYDPKCLPRDALGTIEHDNGMILAYGDIFSEEEIDDVIENDSSEDEDEENTDVNAATLLGN